MAIFIGSTTLLGFGQEPGGSGAADYKTNCVTCHAADGHGSSVGKSLHVPDLQSSQVQTKSDAQLIEVITQGHGNMPPFGGRLSSDQIGTLVKYVRTLDKAK
jgi:cytochrome c6